LTLTFETLGLKGMLLDIEEIPARLITKQEIIKLFKSLRKRQEAKK
jgi:hypothetical protein